MSSAATVLIEEFASICNTERHDPSQVYQDNSGRDLIRALRARAGYAREEGNGTALGDALHFEKAADTIERLLAEVGGRPRHLREGERA